ncbi:MAG: alpha/beta hydrolase [Bdellovibrio sp.]|nr:alpha/beta hydrolase [Bdellovibrio sp.]
MKSIYQIAVLLILANPVWAANKASDSAIPETGFIEISPAQHIAYDSAIVDADKATLVILPGVFRGLNRNDEFIKSLIQKKINFVTMNFSTQPASVATYAAEKKTYFDGGSNISSKGFADEVEVLVDTLKIKRPLVITLSYSGSVSQFLNVSKFPTIIETAPVGLLNDEDQKSAANLQALENWYGTWGILLAPAYFATKDANYHQYWQPVAKQYSASDKRLDTDENLKRLTDGYVGMAKAIEKYDMRQQNFKSSPKRVFIFGENEDEVRKKTQLEAVEVYKKQTGLDAKPIIIQGAGHIVPNDKPEEYIQILSAILNKMDEKIKK